MIGRQSATLALLVLLVPALAMAQRGGGRPSMGGLGGGRPSIGGMGGGRPSMGGMSRGPAMGGMSRGPAMGGMGGGRPSMGGMGGMSRGPAMGGMGGGSMMGRPSMGGISPGASSMPRAAFGGNSIGGVMRSPSMGGLSSGSVMRRPSMGGLPSGGVMSRPSSIGAPSLNSPSGVGLSGLGSRPSITSGPGIRAGGLSRSTLGGVGLNATRPSPSLGGPGIGSAALGAGGLRPSIGGGTRPGLTVNGADLLNRQSLRPAFPSSGAAIRGSNPLTGSGRPSTNLLNPGAVSGLSANRPQLGASTRPSIGSGLRPGLGSDLSSGTRPGASTLPNGLAGNGARPSIGTGTRPGIGGGLGSGARPGASTLPNGLAGNGARPSIGPGERPGIGGGMRPGLGGNTGNGARPGGLAGNGGRPSILPGERPGIGGGLASGGSIGGGLGGIPGIGGNGGWNQGSGWNHGSRWNQGGWGGGGHGAGAGRWRDGIYNGNNWVQGYWTGYGDGFRDGVWTTGLGWGGLGWGGGGWGWPGWGLGWGGLGWGWPGLGLGWGGLGWGINTWSSFGLGLGVGWGGFGWGGLGWGLGNWGWGGWGMSPWALGTPYYSWGFADYVNPYLGSVIVDPAIGFDSSIYAQPLNTLATATVAPAQASATGPAADFESARAAFRVGEYAEALRLTEKAIAVETQDATLHEFRALCLFALGRYDEAATTLYAVLAVGPGWDWPTLIGLYPSVDIYTPQLRRLEEACKAEPDATAPRFVLAYHYLTQGHRDAAAKVLRKLVELQPKDTLAAQLLAQLEPPNAGIPPAIAAPPVAPAGAADGPQFPLTGTWKAQPNEGSTITLTVKDDGSFTWDVAQKDQNKRMSGTSTLGKTGLLTLVGGPGDGALVGQLRWTDADHVHFALVGAPANDPGLNFTRESK